MVKKTIGPPFEVSGDTVGSRIDEQRCFPDTTSGGAGAGEGKTCLLTVIRYNFYTELLPDTTGGGAGAGEGKT